MQNKKHRKFFESIFGVILASFIIMFISSIPMSIIYLLLTPLEFLGSEFMYIAEMYLLTLGGIITYLLVMLVFKCNRHMFKKFTLKNNKLFHGIILGFILNTLCVIVAVLAGSLKLEFTTLKVPLLIFAVVAVFIQCADEEIFCRIYMYQKLKSGYNAKVAVIANSIIFGLLHIFNDGITVIAMISLIGFGLLMSMYVYCFDDIWGAIGLHFSWNFTQNLIYGMPNSGMLPLYSVFKVTESSKSLVYDPIFGIEGTILTVIIVYVTTYLFYLYSKKEKINQQTEVI